MTNIQSYLTFKIGTEIYGANVSYVHNIIEIPKITQVPEMPNYMLGVINLRGKVLPVIDTRVKFGITNNEITANTCIIVMEVNIDDKQVLLGTLVDAVDEVLEIDDNEIKDPPSIGKNAKSDFIIGVYPIDDKFALILAMEKVLNTGDIELSALVMQD